MVSSLRAVCNCRWLPLMRSAGDSFAGKTPGAAAADASLGKLLTTKSVILGGLIFAFQQFAGINAIIYFSSNVFAQVQGFV